MGVVSTHVRVRTFVEGRLLRVMGQRRPVVSLCADAAHGCRIKGGPVWRNEEERPREPETSPNETARSSPGSILCALVHIGEKTWRLFFYTFCLALVSVSMTRLCFCHSHLSHRTVLIAQGRGSVL